MNHNMVLSYDYAKRYRLRRVNECPSIAGHFDGHDEALTRYMRHHRMQHVQGCTRNRWTPPSGDYSLCIALAAARATANKTTMY